MQPTSVARWTVYSTECCSVLLELQLAYVTHIAPVAEGPPTFSVRGRLVWRWWAAPRVRVRLLPPEHTQKCCDTMLVSSAARKCSRAASNKAQHAQHSEDVRSHWTTHADACAPQGIWDASCSSRAPTESQTCTALCRHVQASLILEIVYLVFQAHLLAQLIATVLLGCTSEHSSFVPQLVLPALPTTSLLQWCFARSRIETESGSAAGSSTCWGRNCSPAGLSVASSVTATAGAQAMGCMQTAAL